MDPYYIFTAAQLQEFELQALFFKFMKSGHPIPHDLIFSISKQRTYTTQPPSQPKSQQVGIGMRWSWFEMGRKTDPEPKRCRRTDGKKWRCSGQTFGDSKYCERHIHRGKSRPAPTRVLVESKPHQLQSQSSSHSNLTSLPSFKTNVKDPNFMTSHAIDCGWGHEPSHSNLSNQQKQRALLCSDDVMKRDEKRQRMMKIYHQFIEESPSPNEKRDSWLSLVI